MNIPAAMNRLLLAWTLCCLPLALAVASDPAPGSLDALMASLDKNHDGKVSKEEAKGPYERLFSQWDADHDGFATREEIHQYRQRFGIDDKGQRRTPKPIASPPVLQSAKVLKEPEDWRLEVMSVPPGFAPNVKLSGTEEIRFAPGMFKPDANDYFTCAIVITAEGAPVLGAPEIKDFLEKYYRGLCTSVAQRSGTKPEVKEMKAFVMAAPDSPSRFTGQVTFFDSFSDGRKVPLHVEIETLVRPEAKKTFMILLVSSNEKDDKLWASLRDIGKKAAKNVPAGK